MGEALGCGGHVGAEDLQALQLKLEPMWRTLPKNPEGNVDRRALRYLVHRHFNRESALHVRGFEPSRPASPSGWGSADVLAQRVPGFVESVLESRHRQQQGFSLQDAAHVVATLQQLIFDAEASLLERAYSMERQAPGESLNGERLGEVLASYMVHWMLGDDDEGIRLLLANRTLLAASIPHWDQIVGFAAGQVKALEYRRQSAPMAALAEATARSGHNALEARYSFEDAHTIIGGIRQSFASYWESECSAMKSSLVDMDTHRTGRVPLAKFYGTGLELDWRFGESEEYLRDLGALDETSWRGKQVIIPNYIQSASNCIISSTHYRVCCVNDCEALLDDIEHAIGAPTASPAELLRIVGNLSSHVSVEDDAPPVLDGSLAAQLEQIAATHGGEVPLHGRLFAQWLHYAYPRECPFPHKSGAVAAMTPQEFGDRYVATSAEMHRHASEANSTDLPASVGKEELQWMSQWSPEEELITPHAGGGGLGATAGSGLVALGGAALLALAALLGVVRTGSPPRKGCDAGAGLLPFHAKAHFV